jgi:hypothetical protein
MRRDLRYAIRTLINSPAFTSVAVLTLALGITASTAIFSAGDAVLLHPLSFPHAERLVDVTKTMPMFGLFKSRASPLDYVDYRSRTKVFSEMAAMEGTQLNLTGPFQPERLPGMRVFATLFEMLGVTPVLGRTFAPEQDGVSAVGALSSLPFTGSNRGGDFHIIGHRRRASRAIPDVDKRSANPDYFQAMQIPVLLGRGFAAQDGPNAPKVAVVDVPFVKQFFARENPIGRQRSGPGNDPSTIAGVLGGVKHRSLLTLPAATIYYSVPEAPEPRMAIVIRTPAGDPLGLWPRVRGAVAAWDGNLPVSRVSTREQLLTDSLARTRFSTTLLAVLAALALLLAAIGMYGVASYTVARRGPEIGIRMALGAQLHDAVLPVLRQGATPVLAGILAGFLISFGGARGLGSSLYGVTATDPLTFGALSLLLAAVAFAAIYIPARKASVVDPTVAPRSE